MACLRVLRVPKRPPFLLGETSLFSSKPERQADACGFCHIEGYGAGAKNPSSSSMILGDARIGDSVMSSREFLMLVVTAALIALAAGVHSPYGESLAAVWASMGLVK
jgi:hypothetical protein